MMTDDGLTIPPWPSSWQRDLARREAAYEALDDLAQPIPMEYRLTPSESENLVAIVIICLWPVAAVGIVLAAALLAKLIGG
jgi:hypothetical protein